MPMTTRPRRVSAARLDVRMESDVEMDDEQEDDEEEENDVDVEAVGEEDGEDQDNAELDDEDDEDDDDEVEDEEEEDQIQSDGDNVDPTPQVTPAPSSRLKIRLKMPGYVNRFGTDTPTIESEDSMSNDSHPSTTTIRPMTTRQAVLASVLDSTHVSLGGSRLKKPPLNESELALRREETARKRRNLSEKKLEDEKAETINRLLKKQSRPKNKRTTAQHNNMDDIATPSDSAANSNSVIRYPLAGRKRPATKSNITPKEEQEEGDGDGAVEGADENGGGGGERGSDVEKEVEPMVVVPTMYRWVSSCHSSDTGVTMGISFSVPLSVIPSSLSQSRSVPTPTPTPKICAAPGCTNVQRYRVVKDPSLGACGLSCLKVLDGRA